MVRAQGRHRGVDERLGRRLVGIPDRQQDYVVPCIA
jgi:hypothetical protein